MNPYEILGISKNSSKEDIKKAYKDIALSCHPDKLHDIDDVIKNEKIEKFKSATYAYKLLCDGKCNDYTEYDKYFSTHDWKECWNTFFSNDEDPIDIIKDTFKDIANIFIHNNIKPRSYYVPTKNCDIMKHNIKLKVTYNEVYCNVKKKLRLILKNIEEPIFIDIYSGKYPKVVKNYIDDNGSEHEINIKFILEKNDNYHHVIDDDLKINLITTMEISLHDYICGNEIELDFINNKKLNITVPPFEKNLIIKKGYGLLNNGDLIINIIVKLFEKNEWNKIIKEDRGEMIRILNALY
jgi:DnaJ-class molecular chaperone